MRENYDESLRRLLKHEGGYTNHPSDPGGPTKYGITIHDYRKYVNKSGTAADVKAMTLEQAMGIYRARYWDSQKCDLLPSGVDYAIFDYGVNSGIGRSGKVLRRLLGMPDNTHVITNAVVSAANKRDAAELVKAICDERLAFLKRLRTWPTFGKGWGRRVAEVRAHALKLAGNPPQPDVEPVPEEDSPHHVPWWKRLWLRWFGGSVGTFLGLSGLTDAQVAAVMIAGAFLFAAIIVGAVMIFIGENGRGTVRAWIVRQFKD